MKASIYTLQLETISFLLIPFWVIITELQHQAMKESSKLPLDPLTLFTNFYADDFDHVPELQWDILHCPPEGYGTTLILSVKKQQQQKKILRIWKEKFWEKLWEKLGEEGTKTK